MLLQRFRKAYFVALPLFIQAVISQYIADIVYPSGNASYNIIDTVMVQWNSSVANSESFDPALSNPVLFAWFLDLGTGQVKQVSQVEVNKTSRLEYNFQSFSNGLITTFPASMWFNLFYDTAVVATPNQEGFNGKVFSVYSNGAAAPTTWDITTSFAGTATAGVSPPAGTASTTASTASTVTSSSTPTAIPTSPPTTTSNSQPAGGKGLGSAAETAVIVILSIAVALLIGIIVWLARTRRRSRDPEKPPTPIQCGSLSTIGTSESGWTSTTGLKPETDEKSDIDGRSEIAGKLETDGKSESEGTVSTWL